MSSECNPRSLHKGEVDGSLLQGERRGGREVAAERFEGVLLFVALKMEGMTGAKQECSSRSWKRQERTAV